MSYRQSRPKRKQKPSTPATRQQGGEARPHRDLPGNEPRGPRTAHNQANRLNTPSQDTSQPSYPAKPQGRNRRPPQHPGLACKLMGDVKSTGLGRDRLRSVDRNNKATLLLTRRCRTTKSSAKDLSPRMVKLQSVS